MIWQNKLKETIPLWVQGRGSGESGGTLYVLWHTSYGKTKELIIRNNDWVGKLPGKDKIYKAKHKWTLLIKMFLT